MVFPMDLRIRAGADRHLGWQYAHRRGRLYPGAAERRWLERYAESFATVEVNATFYRLPRPAVVEDWGRRVPPDFTFAVKASRYLTHVRRLREPREPVRRLMAALEPLRDRLGPVLLQLPPNMRRDLDALDGVLRSFGAGVRVAVEPRQASWFEPRRARCRSARAAALCGRLAGVAAAAVADRRLGLPEAARGPGDAASLLRPRGARDVGSSPWPTPSRRTRRSSSTSTTTPRCAPGTPACWPPASRRPAWRRPGCPGRATRRSARADERRPQPTRRARRWLARPGAGVRPDDQRSTEVTVPWDELRPRSPGFHHLEVTLDEEMPGVALRGSLDLADAGRAGRLLTEMAEAAAPRRLEVDARTSSSSTPAGWRASSAPSAPAGGWAGAAALRRPRAGETPARAHRSGRLSPPAAGGHAQLAGARP